MSRERRTALAIGVAVFLSGAVLLGVEITASRVLAPMFGSSLYVWGSLIGIVLTGLAVGYWAGGVVAVDVDDGRRWLARPEKRWDVIVIDAFYADAIPFHLTTHEFLQLVRERLAPGGVVVVNLIGSLTGDGSKLLRSLTKTYRSSFSTVLLYPVYETVGENTPTYTRNVVLVATDAAAPSTAFLRRWARRRPRPAP